MHKLKERARLVEQVREYLENQGQPRLVMLGILVVALAAGFLASVAMVHLGLGRMSIRYPVAVGFAYVTFLGLLWGWLHRHQTTARALSEDQEGLFFVPAATMGIAVGKGDDRDPDGERQRKDSNGYCGVADVGGVGDGFGVIAILVLIAVICTLIVSVYLVVTSPVLLAELLVDGALLGVMSRAVHSDQSPHWSRGVLRRTWLVATITAIVFGLVGLGIERVAPGAQTLGEAWAVERSLR